MELYNTCEASSFYDDLVKKGNSKVELGTRGIFLYISSAVLFTINSLHDKIKPMNIIPETKSEIPYVDGTEFIKRANRKNDTKTNELTEL
jgi:hypothetical protein